MIILMWSISSSHQDKIYREKSKEKHIDLDLQHKLRVYIYLSGTPLMFLAETKLENCHVFCPCIPDFQIFLQCGRGIKDAHLYGLSNTPLIIRFQDQKAIKFSLHFCLSLVCIPQPNRYQCVRMLRFSNIIYK